MIAVAIAVTSHAQESPSVSLDAPTESVAIEVLDEPDGAYLSPESLRGILKQVDSNARVEWDSPAGVLRIDAGGRQMQAVLKTAVLDIDGTTRAVPTPLRMKSSGVIVPMQTAKLILAALNLELEIAEESPAAPLSQSGSLTMRMSDESDVLEEAGFNTSSPARARSSALPEIVLPQGVAGETGLTWSQLGDSRHSQAPRKLLITFDAELERFATEMRNEIIALGGPDAQLMKFTGKRNDPRAVAQVVGQYPDLHVDLMLSPTASAEGTGSGRATWGIEIWTAHDALWPGDREATEDSPQAVQFPYRQHQYHNLALGSLVRSELYSVFPGRSVLLELAPAYLLRRMNAPCIAILISPAMVNERGAAASNAAEAAGVGVAQYVRGMQAVTGTR